LIWLIPDISEPFAKPPNVTSAPIGDNEDDCFGGLVEKPFQTPYANDAAAICEAVTRPSMRFVPIKTEEQQTVSMLHRTRQLLVRQRTM
jgi:hypothetical protein